MGMDLYADVYWGIKVEKDAIDRLIDGEDAEIDEVELDSSMLQRAKYDPDNKYLMVEFSSGEWYRYSDVPLKVFRGLTAAKSVGAYFNKTIKDKFNVEPFSPDDDEPEVAFDSLEQIEEEEGIRIGGYCDDQDYFSEDYDGYLVGFVGGEFWGFGPQEFDPASFKVDRRWRKQLETFCKKYNIPWDEPRWWINLRGSI